MGTVKQQYHIFVGSLKTLLWMLEALASCVGCSLATQSESVPKDSGPAVNTPGSEGNPAVSRCVDPAIL